MKVLSKKSSSEKLGQATILVDFDDVIFNTKKFVADRGKIFAANGISEKIYKQCYHADVVTGQIRKYECRAHIRRARKLVTFDVERLENKLDKHLKDVKKYIFPDAWKFLKEFKWENLCLISFSKTEFQREKITNSGITKYFRKIYIVDVLKSEVVRKAAGKNSSKIFFIDDRTEQINAVKEKYPEVLTFLLQRRDGRYFDKKTKFCDFDAKDLMQVSKIIKK
jgi:FMN phosphatase YigB (HAD superfamily)